MSGKTTPIVPTIAKAGVGDVLRDADSDVWVRLPDGAVMINLDNGDIQRWTKKELDDADGNFGPFRIAEEVE